MNRDEYEFYSTRTPEEYHVTFGRTINEIPIDELREAVVRFDQQVFAARPEDGIDGVRRAVQEATLRGGGVIHLSAGTYDMTPGRIETIIIDTTPPAETFDGEPLQPVRRVIRMFCDGVNWYTMDDYGPVIEPEVIKQPLIKYIKREESLIIVD